MLLRSQAIPSGYNDRNFKTLNYVSHDEGHSWTLVAPLIELKDDPGVAYRRGQDIRTVIEDWFKDVYPNVSGDEKVVTYHLEEKGLLCDIIKLSNRQETYVHIQVYDNDGGR